MKEQTDRRERKKKKRENPTFQKVLSVFFILHRQEMLPQNSQLGCLQEAGVTGRQSSPDVR